MLKYSFYLFVYILLLSSCGGRKVNSPEPEASKKSEVESPFNCGKSVVGTPSNWAVWDPAKLDTLFVFGLFEEEKTQTLLNAEFDAKIIIEKFSIGSEDTVIMYMVPIHPSGNEIQDTLFAEFPCPEQCQETIFGQLILPKIEFRFCRNHIDVVLSRNNSNYFAARFKSNYRTLGIYGAEKIRHDDFIHHKTDSGGVFHSIDQIK